jgi:hypothetical protein
MLEELGLRLRRSSRTRFSRRSSRSIVLPEICSSWRHAEIA